MIRGYTVLDNENSVNRELIIKVRELINTQGEELYTNSKKLKAFLNDYFPNLYNREKRLIVDSVEQKIPEVIISYSDSEIDSIMYNNLVKRLYDNLGISQELSESTVQFWCQVFDKTYIRTDNMIQNPASYTQGSIGYPGNGIPSNGIPNTNGDFPYTNNSMPNMNNSGFNGMPNMNTNMNSSGLNGMAQNSMYNQQVAPAVFMNPSQQINGQETVFLNNNNDIKSPKLSNKKKIIIGAGALLLIVLIAIPLAFSNMNNKKQVATNQETRQVNTSSQPKEESQDKQEPEKQQPSRTITSNNFILKDSNQNKIESYRLYNLTSDQLFIARNEIFARHGYIFKEKKLQAYFEKQAWYNPDPNAVGTVSDPIEKYNVDHIRDIEEVKLCFKNSPTINRDYILYDSDYYKLSTEEIERLSNLEILLARNEIFARHGYIFGVPELNDYFQTKPWYYKVSNDVTLNEVEAYNVEALKAVEEKRVYDMLYNYTLGDDY